MKLSPRTKGNLTHLGLTCACGLIAFWNIGLAASMTGVMLGCWISQSGPVERFCQELKKSLMRASLK